MCRLMLSLFFACLVGIANPTMASDATRAGAFVPLSGEWSGWWKPRGIYHIQGNLSLTLRANTKTIDGTMKMDEVREIGGEMTLKEFGSAVEGTFTFVGQSVNGSTLHVSLQFLDDKSALYGTGEIGGKVFYLRLTRRTK